MLALVEETSDDEGLVVATVNLYPDGNGDIMMGWFVAENRRGRGIASAAASVVLDRLFADGVANVGVGMRPGNAASLRIAEKIGFDRSAAKTYDDAVFLSLSSARWRARMPGSRPPEPGVYAPSP